MNTIAVLENLPQNNFSYHYGRYVLNSNFLNALMQHSSFDEIHFFVDNLEEGKKSLNLLRQEVFYKKIKIFPVYTFAEKLKLLKYTAIHTNMFMLLSGIADIRNKINPKIPITALTATITYPFYDNEFLSLLSRLDQRDAVIAPSSNSCTYIDQICNLVASEATDTSLKRNFRIERIPYGIELPNNSAPNKRSSRIIKILIFNRFSKYDKCDLLPFIPLFRKIIERANFKVKFILAGDSSDANYLDTLLHELKEFGIEKHVQVIPSPKEKRKVQLFKSADIFLALSDNIQESFGLVLLEAMSHALPVVATAWDGYRDLVEEGENGMCVETYKLKNSEKYFFDQRKLAIFPFQSSLSYWKYDTYLNSQITFIDGKSFVEKVLILIENKTLRTNMSRRSHDKVLGFSWQKVIKQYEELWLALSRQKTKESSHLLQTLNSNKHLLDSFYSNILDNSVTQVKLEESNLKHMKRVMINYKDLEGLIDEKLIDEVRAVFRSGSTQFVSDLLSKIDFPTDKVLFNLSWLLKNHFLTLIK